MVLFLGYDLWYLAGAFYSVTFATISEVIL